MKTLSTRSFELRRFTLTDSLPTQEMPNISAKVLVQSPHILDLTFQLNGDLSPIQWPLSQDVPGRKMALWEACCCECFISEPDKPPYIEVNVSPSRDWNCFRFEAYRAGMTEAQDLFVRDAKFDLSLDTATLKFTLESRGTAIVTTKTKIGVAVILLDDKNRYHYYALSHPSAAPDFHAPTGHLDLL